MRNICKWWCLVLCASIPTLLSAQYDGYTLVWSDEFNGGYTNADPYTGLDLDSWNYEIGSGDWGWGTGQKDYSTRDPENAQVSNGTLKIRTQRHHDNQPTHEYTSGRINSQNKRSFLYGKLEARIRTDNMTESGRGFAFWMLPDGIPAGKSTMVWPLGGEIDIMEYNGLYPDYNLGSMHYAWNWTGNGDEWGGNENHAQASGLYYEPNRQKHFQAAGHTDGCGGDGQQETKDNILGANWRIYGINWYNNRVEFYIRKDDNTVEDVYAVFRIDQSIWCPTYSNNARGNVQSTTGSNYPAERYDNNWRTFENPFYFVLSAGVGGDATYGGSIEWGTNPNQWTCTAEIDWVRVYKLNSANPPTISLAYTKNGNNVTVTPTLKSGSAISKIEYIVDQVPVASTKTAAPFTYTFTKTQSQHIIFARACNSQGYWGNWAKIVYTDNGTATCDNIFGTLTNGGVLESTNWSSNGGNQNTNSNNSTITVTGNYNNIYATWTGNRTMVVGDTYEFSGTIKSTRDETISIYLEDANDNTKQMFTANSIRLQANQAQSWRFVSQGGGFTNPKLVLSATNTTAGTVYTMTNVKLQSTSCDAGDTPSIIVGAPEVITAQNGTTTISVTGSNLTNNITVTSSNNHFTVTPTTLTRTNGNVNSSVTVTYTGTTSENSTITFTSGTTVSSVVVSSHIVGECDNYFETLSSCRNLACTAGWDCGTTWGSSDINGSTFTFSPNDTQAHFYAIVVGNGESLNAGTSYTVSGTITSTATRTLTVNVQEEGLGDNHDTKLTTEQTLNLTANQPRNFEFTATPGTTILVPGITFTMENQANSTYTVTNLSLKKSTCVGFPGINLTGPASPIATTNGTAVIAATGQNLTNNVTVSSSNPNFTVSPTNITISAGAFTRNVTVTYTGNTIENA
ncbi:MAG: glycoside hydrolase family 16 protein, partial [Paludibacteraceae bacterium]|nr:glycoside hydrolase family 16 protein [Paludibacteraceae bacterium]